MEATQFYKTLGVDRSALDRLGFNPYYRPLSGLRRGLPLSQGRVCYDLASNDYLGLASEPRIHRAMAAAIEQYGSSMCGTPVATGYAHILGELEKALCQFVGLEDAVVFPSCYQANQALFGAIAGPGDVILVDRGAHASLVQGIRAAGPKIKPFRHNDLDHLEKLLVASTGFRQSFVVTESVFSTEGAVAPLAGIVGLCRRHEAVAVVDDSHGLGVLGTGGRGILQDQALADFEGIYTASLGKALANAGGVIAGKRALIEALRYCCPALIYSTALTPSCAGGVLAALDILRLEFGVLGKAMWQNHRRLQQMLQSRGFELHPAGAPIAAIRCLSPEHTIALARDFWRQAVLTTPFVPPSVPPGQGVLRLIAGAKLSEPALSQALEAVERVGTQIPEAALAVAEKGQR